MHSDRRNSAWLSAQHLLLLVLSLVNLRLNLAAFGKEAFDVWLLFSSLWGVGSVLDFGFGIAVVNLVARGVHEGDDRLVGGVISTGAVVFAAAGALLVATGHLVAHFLYFPDTRLVPAAFPSAFAVFALLGTAFFFQYLSIFLRSVIEGVQDFVGSSRISMANSLLVTGGVTTVFMARLPMTALAGFYAGAAVVQCVAYGVLIRRRLGHMRIGPSAFRVDVLPRLLGFGAAIQVTYLLGSLVDPVVKYIMGIAGNSGTISTYEIARRFSLAISGLFHAAFRNHLPKTSVLTRAPDARTYLTTEGAGLVATGISYAAVAFGIGSLALVILMTGFFRSPESVLFFFVLALGETINIVGYMNYVFLLGTGRAASLMLVQSSNLVLTGVGFYVGFALFGSPLGLLGYPLGIIVGNLIMIRTIHRSTGVRLLEVVPRTRLVQLLVVLGWICANLAVITAGLQPLLAWQAALTVIALVIFSRHVVEAYGFVRRALPRGVE